MIRAADYDLNNIENALERQFKLLGGIEKFVSKGDSVLIKPNFIVAKPPQNAAQTDPAVILALAKMLKDFGAKPFIAASPAWKNVDACVRILGLEQPLKKLDIPFRTFKKSVRKKIAGSSINISIDALEADKIINLPKFKSHQQLHATFAVKNMFGCVCGKEKAFWHFVKGNSYQQFCEMLIEIYKLLAPSLTIIDGVTAMQGPGPINGTPKKLGFLISGTDPITCEIVCCKLINIDPDTLPIIQTAKKIGFGTTEHEHINITGDSFCEPACTDFEFAPIIPLRFSLFHVCRRITKQLLLLAKPQKKSG